MTRMSPHSFVFQQQYKLYIILEVRIPHTDFANPIEEAEEI